MRSTSRLIVTLIIAFLAGALVGYVQSQRALANCKSQNRELAKDLGNAVTRGITLEANLNLCKENK